jgi:hypothetical protein
MSLEEFDRRSGPGSGLFVRQAASPPTFEYLGGRPAGRFDQTTAFVQRQAPERSQLIFEQCGLGIYWGTVFEDR